MRLKFLYEVRFSIVFDREAIGSFFLIWYLKGLARRVLDLAHFGCLRNLGTEGEKQKTERTMKENAIRPLFISFSFFKK